MKRHHRCRQARYCTYGFEEEYLAYLLCLDGTCRYRFNERDFEMHAGDLSIIRKQKMVERIEP